MNCNSRFDYVKYDEKATADQADFKKIFMALDDMVNAKIEGGRARALVLTKLEEAYMWIGKAIRDEQCTKRSAELEEGRGAE